MIAQIAIISNWKEIDYATDRIGVDPPAEVYHYEPFGFHLDDVKMFHKDEQANQIVLFFDAGKYYIKFEEKIYQELTNKFQ
jgi:hypothetical protein